MTFVIVERMLIKIGLRDVYFGRHTVELIRRLSGLSQNKWYRRQSFVDKNIRCEQSITTGQHCKSDLSMFNPVYIYFNN